MNDYQFKLAKIKGQFVWHDHKDTDETFIVIEGEMILKFRDNEAKHLFKLSPRPLFKKISLGVLSLSSITNSLSSKLISECE